MIYQLYERLLEFSIAKRRLPACVAIILCSGDLDEAGLEKLGSLLDWSSPLGLTTLVLYVNDDAPRLRQKIAEQLKDAQAEVSLHTAEGVEDMGRGGRMKMIVSVGYGGKHEVAEAIQALLAEVEEGRLDPEDIDESAIESHLRFRQKPELVIRAGGKQLSDFMIWQAAYSELYFTDVDWRSLRRIDFLRAIRDWQRRERRFGH